MRGKRAKKRTVIPDSLYKSEILQRFINKVVSRGKKSIAERLIYDAFETVKKKTGEDPYKVFIKALNNAKPALEVKSRRVGGSTYQVPVEVKPDKQESIAMQWIISYAKARKGMPFSQKLALELIDAYSNTGATIKKKEDTHKMAEANRAYAHYRW